MRYTIPKTQVPAIYIDLLKSNHLIISGCSGSGKSVIENNLIYCLLFDTPNNNKLVLCDPKRVELNQYKELPHVIAYSDNYNEMATIIESLLDTMDERYSFMQEHGMKKYFPDKHVYVFIDEYSDFKICSSKETINNIVRLSQLGRAANIHLVLCTQRATSDIIDSRIKCNIPIRVCLHCTTKQESKNVIDIPDACLLPFNGYGYLYSPKGITKYQFPMIEQDRISAIIDFWKKTYKL